MRQYYKRKGKTNYAKRIGLLKARLPRLVVRISSRNITAQIAEYNADGDKVLFAYSTKSLEKLGWKGARNNIPAAYLLGYLIGSKASKDASKVILDIGQRQSIAQSRIYAVVKGLIDAGVEVPVNEEVLPSEDRLLGKHTEAYATSLAESDKKRYETYFSLYLKNKIKPEELSKHVEAVKGKITGAQ